MLTDEKITEIVREAAKGSAIRRDGSTSHRIARAIESEVTKPLLERIAELEAENTRLEGLVYSPGLWRCAKCKFTLVQRNLNAHSGTVTARDQPGDKCPNCDVNLWRVTERENALENYEAAESLQIRLNELEAKLAQQAEHVPEVHFGKTMKPETLRIELQKKCSAWGAYWRGSDAHGVELTTDQAVELLENALNVEVEIKNEEAAQQAEAQEPFAWYYPADTARCFAKGSVSELYSERCSPNVAPLFTRPQPASEPMTDEQTVRCIEAAGFKVWTSAHFRLAKEAERHHGIGVAK